MCLNRPVPYFFFKFSCFSLVNYIFKISMQFLHQLPNRCGGMMLDGKIVFFWSEFISRQNRSFKNFVQIYSYSKKDFVSS